MIAAARTSSPRTGRAGVTLPEVVVVLLIVLVGLLLLLMALPAGRETARANRCMQNLRLIGEGIKLVDTINGQLPTVPRPGADPADWGPSPLNATLTTLGLNRFGALDVAPGQKPKQGTPGTPPVVRPLPDLICPSDPNATAGRFEAPVSYRACTGSDAAGSDGVFAPGQSRSLASVQDLDGASFTAAFAERLVGTGPDVAQPANYAVVPGPIDPAGCRDLPADAWRGDAGASWARASWTSTLYNHTLNPGGQPSCVQADGRAARIGAGSGHPERIHVLMLDGSLRPVTRRIAPAVWRALARIDDTRTVPTALDEPLTHDPEAAALDPPAAPQP